MPKEGTQSKEKYRGSVCHSAVGSAVAVGGDGERPGPYTPGLVPRKAAGRK